MSSMFDFCFSLPFQNIKRYIMYQDTALKTLQHIYLYYVYYIIT